MEYGKDDPQGEIAFRRITGYELQRLSGEITALKEQQSSPRSIAWWIPTLLSVMIAGVAGYIGIVHQAVLKNEEYIERLRERYQNIADEVQRRATLRPDLDDTRARVLTIERQVQQIPHLVDRINAQDKIHEQLERRFERLYQIEQPQR